MLTSDSHYNDSIYLPALIKARQNQNIRLGLCCINNTLHPQKKVKNSIDIYCSRTCIQKNFTVDKAKELALQNVKDILPLLKWNEKHNIRLMRLSSDMFPHITNSNVEEYTIDFAISELEKAGEYANKYNHRITMHPAQWNQVGALTKNVFKQTVKDLDYHASILDAMKIDDNGILCVHGGGVYGDKETTMRRWIEQFDDLPKRVKKRLAIENCEKCYSVENCLHIANECKIPLIYDTHHYFCYQHYHPNEEQVSIKHLIPDVLDTWKHKRPLFHISEQKQDKPVGTHSDMIEIIPNHLLEIPYEYNTQIDIEVEAKSKEKAILYLMNKYKI